MKIEFSSLEGVPFGARVTRVTEAALMDKPVRAEIRSAFQQCGLIVFQGVEPDNRMQALLNAVFDTARDHLEAPITPEGGGGESFVDLEYDGVSEVDGLELMNYLPWHFDQCYSSVITRGGVLRALTIPPVGGLTGFADGIQLYNAVSPAIRDRFESLNVVYDSSLMFWNMKFGRPTSYRPVETTKVVSDQLSTTSKIRSVHPAIWRRDDGKAVLHVSPMQAAGIEGMETPEGDALLEDMCQEIYAHMIPYYHRWQPTDMVIWDNWRFIHCVTGHPPGNLREMRRTVLFDDYGLGRREHACNDMEDANEE